MSRDLASSIIEARKGLVEELDRLFLPFDLSMFSDLAPVIEGFIEQHVATALLEYVEVIASDAKVIGGGSYLEVGGQHIRIGVAPDLWSQSVLQVVFVPDESPPRRRPKSRNISIDGVGRVQEARLLIAPKVDVDGEAIAQLVKGILETGQAWLGERFRRALVLEEDKMAGEIYSHLRTVLPEQDVWARVWFWSYIDGEGAYLGDPKLSEAKLADIREHPLSAGKSPIELMVTALTTLSQLTESFTQEALRSGKPIDVDLRTAIYGDEEPLYVVSERLLFGGSSLTIYPIVSSGRGLFLAGFPAAMRGDLVPVFDRHVAEFRERFLASRSKIQKLFGRLASGRPDSAPKIAELVGRFTRGILGIQ